MNLRGTPRRNKNAYGSAGRFLDEGEDITDVYMERLLTGEIPDPDRIEKSPNLGVNLK
jgi:hypothetical protein